MALLRGPARVVEGLLVHFPEVSRVQLLHVLLRLRPHLEGQFHLVPKLFEDVRQALDEREIEETRQRGKMLLNSVEIIRIWACQLDDLTHPAQCFYRTCVSGC